MLKGGVIISTVFSAIVGYSACFSLGFYGWVANIGGIIGGIIGARVGIICIRKMEEVDKRAAEEQIRQENIRKANEIKAKAEKEYKIWCDTLSNKYMDIVNQAWQHKDITFNPEPCYEKIFNQFNVKNNEVDNKYLFGHAKELYDKYIDSYEEQKFNHIACLENNLVNIIKNANNEKDLIGIKRAINLLHCLTYIDSDEVNNKAIETLKVVYKQEQGLLVYLKENTYGNFEFPLESEDIFQAMKSVMEKDGLQSIYTYLNKLDNSGENVMQLVADGEFSDFLESTAKAMWYYAKLKPFDVNNFNESIELFNKYRLQNGLPKVEVILAKIYSKNQLGGKELVCQDLKAIEEWVGNVKDYSAEECILLASGLAWMELYDIELHMLRKFVEMGIQLPEHVQERLSFLENGGTADIKVYQIEPSTDFLFDSDSLDWNAKDYSVFFRKLAMKKMDMNYSLAQTKWTKTLPLASGQKVSFDELYQEFVALVDDFDNEISCEIALAKAVNLKNLEYPQAVIFRFLSERSRCVSVLFSCEKYGRNLNITMITMFTPDNTVDIDSLEQYCQAIKNNMYVDSFRESISQVVDSVLNPKQSTYGDGDVFE